jgi:5-methylcytosine-specific restriction enzyme subunit McrC
VNIPVRNVYFLLLYAWRHIGEGEETLLRDAPETDLKNLFAHVLAGATARLIARGLDRQYVEVEEVISGIRGKLDLNMSLKRNQLAVARAQCRFDELQHDVLHNRILKATLRALLRTGLDVKVRDHVHRLYLKLDTISDVRITARDFGRVQLHRNNRAYDLSLRIARLIHDNLMVEEGTGAVRFRDFRREEKKMARIFEEFVFGFYRNEQRAYRVSRPHITWFDAQGSEASLARLPVMRTDVVLTSSDRCIILDTKYYVDALAGAFEEKKVRSSHLYQMFAYVENRAAHTGDKPPHEAMLVYPVVKQGFRYDYRLKGRRISIRSVDLDQPWQGVRNDLLGLLEN